MHTFRSSSIFDLAKIDSPSNLDQANANLEKLGEISRRSLLTRGLVTAAAVPAAVLATSSISEAASGGLPSYVSGSTTRYLQTLQVDESSHVNILVAAIKSLGGTVRPYPTFSSALTASSVSDFLAKAIAFENTGVGAYFGAAPYISNPAVVNVALSIALVEGYHAGFLNTLGNMALVPNGATYVSPLTIAQVTSAATPFITSLNDNGAFPATFSTTPSAANDIAILNFALLLEFLEATFYFINVPKFFS